ncbi:hypothetical protein [Bdellovibrio bacteriovorus]|uniref:hypothetical protein n=1 Tax=Bdellovibrio bacteriovorus TaxID=959 RepID=UPI0035A69A13
MNAIKKFSCVFALVLGFANIAQAGKAQILCTGSDDSGAEFAVQMLPESSTLGVNGLLRAKTSQGVKTLSKNAALADLDGKSEDWESRKFTGDLFVEADVVFMNLIKAGRGKYEGEICGPHNKIVVGGIVFQQNDCLAITCKAKNLSTLR